MTSLPFFSVRDVFAENLIRFLPYTIHFDIKVDKGQPRKDPSSGKPASKESAGLSLFSAKPAINDAVNSTVKAAAAAADEVISFFSKSDRPECPERPGLKRGPSVLQDILLASAIAPNEPHSPAWGQTEYFVQPQLRSADYVPPASVLQRDLAESWRQLNGSPKTSNHKDSQSSSYERAMKTAEWSVQPAEQGNGGLRNAVYAAHQKGDFEPFTWVSFS